MKHNLDSTVERDIIQLARENGVKRLLLFGSRARGDCRERSDIDLAASGGDILNFYYDLEEKARTLLSFDVVNLDAGISQELQNEINRDGVTLFEEI